MRIATALFHLLGSAPDYISNRDRPQSLFLFWIPLRTSLASSRIVILVPGPSDTPHPTSLPLSDPHCPRSEPQHNRKHVRSPSEVLLHTRDLTISAAHPNSAPPPRLPPTAPLPRSVLTCYHSNHERALPVQAPPPARGPASPSSLAEGRAQYLREAEPLPVSIPAGAEAGNRISERMTLPGAPRSSLCFG